MKFISIFAAFPLLFITDANLISYRIDFEALTSRPYFVDKTGLIEEFFKINNTPNFVVYAKPKFGKSVNADMVRRFVQMEVNETTGIPLNKTQTSAYRLFTDATLNMSISQRADLIEEHLGEYPTIFLDFGLTRVYENFSFEDITNLLRDDLSTCFEKYQWLCRRLEEKNKNEKSNVVKGQIRLMKKAINKNLTTGEMRYVIRNLTDILYSYFGGKKVIIIVDEYAKMDWKKYGIDGFLLPHGALETNMLIGQMLDDVIMNANNTKYVFMSVLCMREDRPSFYLKCEKVKYFWKASRIYKYYGFNDCEVENLCDRYKVTKAKRKELQKIHLGDYVFDHDAFDKFRLGGHAWEENGFMSDVKVYNPFLVVRFLEDIRNKETTYKEYLNDTSVFLRSFPMDPGVGFANTKKRN